jgi:SAM-dependent methyltransferase
MSHDHITPGCPLPLEFDHSFYRAHSPDLAHLSCEELPAHNMQHGRGEGRPGSRACHRAGFLATLPADAHLLEIGPFTRPVFRGPNARYFDVMDRQRLVARAQIQNYETDIAVDIDYVSPVGDLSVVTETFDYVLSSHVIEHQPDLIQHLNHVARILRKGGLYYLMVPDKRYCFDHFIDESVIGEVRLAHRDQRRTHCFKSVYEHLVMTTHNNAIDHWNNMHDDPRRLERSARAESALRLFEDALGGYIDVHAWQFTPANFRTIMTELCKTAEIQLNVERVYETPRSSGEFCAVLRSP